MTKANSFQGISPLAKLLCVPVNKRPSKTRDSKLLHVSSGNNTSLAVKKYTHLTNSISGCCNPLAWSLPPVELFVLPFGEPRKETTSSSHYFSAEGISQTGLLCSTTVTAPEERIHGQVLFTEHQHQSSAYSYQSSA